MSDYDVIATGLQFPEGPVVMPDGSIVLVEVKRGTISRIDPTDGSINVVAQPGGGPNGAAVGPDGALYVCNNGGFTWSEARGLTVPGLVPDDYSSGRIERIDIKTGNVEILYAEVNGNHSRARTISCSTRQGDFGLPTMGKPEHGHAIVGGFTTVELTDRWCKKWRSLLMDQTALVCHLNRTGCT